MKIVNIHTPVYVREDKSIIDCVIVLENEQELPFSSTASDTEPHGIEIWEKLNAGEFGEIAPYIKLE